MKKFGFSLLSETVVHELSSTARIWQHEKTGGSLLSFINSDENKAFGVSLRTPPADSSGVAHILEHSVLCGSEKFPVKEPFVELLKGSLQTFLNAFTYPDKTCYPVASTNLKDFRNLTEVYLDAVFFPRITQEIFQQEGWHLEKNEKTGAFFLKGVVYNEMKGAFSAPESVLSRYCLHSLFPDTVYSLESGGAPDAIPGLTYEAFSDFHKRYYHPSNARFFFWGDDPEDERLELLDKVLSRFERSKVISDIPLQKPLAEPRTFKVPFAASEDDKCMVVLNWLGPDVMDVEATLAMRILEHILLGLPASPLRRALIESGLGEDLAGQGLETELRQLTFDAGLKGVNAADVEKVEPLIFKTLAELVEQGIPGEMLEAALNSVEFDLRENNSGRFPVGLAVMLRSLTTWMHDGDPLAPLCFEKPLGLIKSEIAKGNSYFEKMIRCLLLDNKHRTKVILEPDPRRSEILEQEEADYVAKLCSRYKAEDFARLQKESEALHQFQSRPDSPEDLARIPRVGVDDLPRANADIPSEQGSDIEVPLYFHPLPTNGIVYAEAAFDLSCIPPFLVSLLPLFGRALLEMGTAKRDFVELNMTIARKTGGMDIDTLFANHMDRKSTIARLILSGKAAPDKFQDLFKLMTEVLTDCALNQQERFMRMALEEKARLEHSLIPGGHQIVACRLRAPFSTAGRFNEQTNGISYLYYLRALTKRCEDDWEGVLEDLETLRRLIIHRHGLSLNLTALPEHYAILRDSAVAFSNSLPRTQPPVISLTDVSPMDFSAAEALILPAQVNYVGKAANLFDSGYVWHGSAQVILKYLRTSYLWDRVRVHGGAYGCMCGFDRMNGSFFMVSYRDPNINETLAVYDAAAAYLSGLELSREELNAAIVGTIGEVDAYLLPDAKGSVAFTRHLCGDTSEVRQKMRDEILATSKEHFKQFGHALEHFTANGRICALGGNALEKVAAKMDWKQEKVL